MFLKLNIARLYEEKKLLMWFIIMVVKRITESLLGFNVSCAVWVEKKKPNSDLKNGEKIALEWCTVLKLNKYNK